MEATIKLDLSAEQLNLVLVALGQLSYTQVHELIDHIQQQAGPQLLAVHKAQNQNVGQDTQPSS